jgi:biofilm PGA synthesis N-glycosyltransferase PgaC
VTHELRYAAVTPARDEAGNLRRIAAAMQAQSVLPAAWILVDNGSTDETPAIAAELAARLEWVHVVDLPNAETRPGAPVVRAFNAGLATLAEPVDVIVKLDADVSFDERYFEGMLDAFRDDPRLGIASGVCWELDVESGEWEPIHVTGDHVRGATRAYRADCLEQVGPLPEEMGWDGVDELKATVLGWRTASLGNLRFDHHRKLGARDGGRTARWLAEGKCAHYMGYRVPYLLARTVGRAIRDRDPGAFAMPYAFVRCALRREAKYPDESVREYLRSQQSVRHLPVRLRESFGRRVAA